MSEWGPKKTILIFGALGEQGSTVASHIAQENTFKVRAYVPEKSKETKNLERLGIRICKGDMSDEEAMKRAMKGVDYIYAATDFWHIPKKPEVEEENGMKFLNCVKESDIKHICFGALENINECDTQAWYGTETFDRNSKFLERARQMGLPFSQIRIPFYMENFIEIMRPERSNDGVVVFDLPMESHKLELICADDVGKFIVEVFKNPQNFQGKCLKIASESLNGEEIASVYSKVTGDKSKYQPMNIKEFRRKTEHLEFPDVLVNLFEFYHQFTGKLKDVECSKKIVPDLISFEQWLRKTKFKVE